jgi:NADH-quinone oxidoreductase subunit N
MAGLFQQRPWLSLALTVFALSGLGLPPFAGFWGKYYVFMAAVNAGDPVLLWSAVAALLGAAVFTFPVVLGLMPLIDRYAAAAAAALGLG